MPFSLLVVRSLRNAAGNIDRSGGTTPPVIYATWEAVS